MKLHPKMHAWFEYIRQPSDIGKGASEYAQIQGPISPYGFIGRGIVPGFRWRIAEGAEGVIPPHLGTVQGLGGLVQGVFATQPLVNLQNYNLNSTPSPSYNSGVLPTYFNTDSLPSAALPTGRN